jgi:hypothetical protein
MAEAVGGAVGARRLAPLPFHRCVAHRVSLSLTLSLSLSLSLGTTAQVTQPGGFNLTSPATMQTTLATLSQLVASTWSVGSDSDAATDAAPRRRYCDEKVANRDTKVWHGATENGP